MNAEEGGYVFNMNLYDHSDAPDAEEILNIVLEMVHRCDSKKTIFDVVNYLKNLSNEQT